MRILIFISAVLLLVSCSGKKAVAKNESEPAKESPVAVQPQARPDAGLDEFLTRLEQAMIRHDKITMLDLMDADYRKQQFEKNMNSNIDRFMDSLFCSYQTNGQGFKCVKFNDISEVKRIETMPNDGHFSVTYHVTGKGSTVKCDYLVLVRREGKGGSKITYGLYGPAN